VDGLNWNFQGPDRSDTVSFIRSFCADYKIWNDTAMTVTNGLTGSEKRAAMQDASGAYRHFLAPFVASDTMLQLIAFGSSSSFDPSHLEFTTMDDLSTNLSVGFSIMHAHLSFNDDYVAEIESGADGELVLKQIWYLDPFPEDGQERLASL
jgi:hypothetical protein